MGRQTKSEVHETCQVLSSTWAITLDVAGVSLQPYKAFTGNITWNSSGIYESHMSY